MHTYIFEGVVTALTSISHIGERHGIHSKLRREKIVQPDGTVEEIPIISGNSLRGILRDRGMVHMLKCLGYGVNEDTGKVSGLSLAAFYFLLSGGALESVGSRGLDIDKARRWCELIPLVAMFGGAMGNQIMKGKLKIGKAIPICQETAHLLPERFVPLGKEQIIAEIVQAIETPTDEVIRAVTDKLIREVASYGGILSQSDWVDVAIRTMRAFDNIRNIEFSNTLASIWDMCQEEAYTRRDDEKDEKLRQLIAPKVRGLLEAKAAEKREKVKSGDDIVKETGQKQQMRYYVETLAAGTKLFWDITMDDVTPLEFEAFCVTLAEFSRLPYIGGKSGVGHGKVAIHFDNWIEINPRTAPTGKEISFALGNLYKEHLEQRGSDIRELLNGLS